MPPKREEMGKGSTERAKKGFSAEERAAMQEAVREYRTQARRGGKTTPEDGENDVRGKIAEMPSPDRETAQRLHTLIREAVPQLAPRTWYGMPAYSKDGEVLCWFQPASKFKARYGMLGFSDEAKLDEGALWPVAYAISELTPAGEARIVKLVKQAAGAG